VRHAAAKTDCVDQRNPRRDAGEGTVAAAVRRMRRRRDVDAMRVRRSLRRPAAAGEDAATAPLEGNDARRWRRSGEGRGGCVAIVVPAPSLRSVGRFVRCRAAAPVRSGRRISRRRAAARESGEARGPGGGGRCIVRPLLGRVSQRIAGGYVVRILSRRTNVGSNDDYITNPTAPAPVFFTQCIHCFFRSPPIARCSLFSQTRGGTI
jgi:hypothetical protein